MDDYIFWAQNLDNQDDCMKAGGSTIEERSEKQAIYESISRMSAVGKRFVDGESKAELYVRGDQFVLKVFPEDLDEDGRDSPVICYGNCATTFAPESTQEAWVEDVVSNLEAFVRCLGRNPSTVRGQAKVLREFQKRNLKCKLIGLLIGVGSFGLFGFLTMWLMGSTLMHKK